MEFCLSYANWVLATGYTWKNLSRLCQVEIWLVPKRYKKTAGTSMTCCVTDTFARYVGYLQSLGNWSFQVSRLPAEPLSVTQLVKLGKVLISSLPHIYGFMYIMWFVTACSFIWYLVWKFALQLSFGWWKIEQLKIIKKTQFPLICFFPCRKLGQDREECVVETLAICAFPIPGQENKV